jgi:hypothetical protein
MAEVAGLAAAAVSIESEDEDGYLEGMSDQDIARFRAQAEECLQQAERAISAARQRGMASDGRRVDEAGTGCGTATTEVRWPQLAANSRPKAPEIGTKLAPHSFTYYHRYANRRLGD